MSVTVNPCETTNNCNFRGKWDKTEQGTPYYKTHSAMKIGGTLAGIATAGTLINLASNNFGNKLLKSSGDALDKTTKEIYEMSAKRGKNAIIISGLITLATHLGCAAIIDSKRNQKAKEVANYAKQVGAKNAVKNNDEISLSNKGRAYYESNVGSKYGAWLGAGAGIIAVAKKHFSEKDAMDQLAKAVKEDKNPKEMETILKAAKIGRNIGKVISVGVTALGGWLLGKWADNIANNDTRKHA